MIIKESKLLQESINQHLIFESRQILLENIKNDPRKYFVINEDYKKYLSDEDYKILEEGIWDTIKSVAGKIGDYFSEKPQQAIQGLADVVSIFDPTGIVDLVNGIFYYYFKDYFSAFFSFLGAILTMPGFLISLSGAGAIAGIPMIAAAKSTKAVKSAIKAGSVGGEVIKELPVVAKVAKGGFEKVASMLKGKPFVGNIGEWLTKSIDNVAALKGEISAVDIQKAVGGGSTEIANNPVVKSLSNNVVSKIGKDFKPSKIQAGFAALSLYGVWGNIEDSELEKIALVQMKEQFDKKGIDFDPKSSVVKKYLPKAVEELRNEKNKCKKDNEEECKSNFEKFSAKFPKTANVITKVGKGIITGAQIGANFLEKTDIRNN